MFLCVFVIFPIIFMESATIQRKIVFPNFDRPNSSEFYNYESYGMEGVQNRHINVTDILNLTTIISIGVWQIVPENRINATYDVNFNYDTELRDSKEPICIYFHGQGGTRISPYRMYQRMRKFFHVLALDYRSYGDSTEAFLTEESVVGDLVQFYYKVLQLTNQRLIYFWGQSLGTALATHTMKTITENQANVKNKILPHALILESGFTSLREEAAHHPLGKIFAWLPWFKVTFTNPLEKNGFCFHTDQNILVINGPIMMLHAMDDNVIPYTLSKKLATIAEERRDKNKRGPVVLHLIPSVAKCGHLKIYTYPELEGFIKKFVTSVDDWYELQYGDKRPEFE